MQNLKLTHLLYGDFDCNACKGAEGKSECIGGMCREEAVAPALFQDVQSVADHEIVVQRADTANGMLDQIGELVAESECKQGCCQDNETAFPSELPDEEAYDCRVHRCPDYLFRKESPDRICYK